MCRSSSVDHILYYVITFLTLGLIGLVFASLSQAYPMHTKVSDLTSRAPQASTPCAGLTLGNHKREISKRSAEFERRIQRKQKNF